jgi:hypothetical protein
MRRLALLALLALAVLSIPAAASGDDGGVPAEFGGGESGGTPAGWSGALFDVTASEAADDTSSLAGAGHDSATRREPTTGASGGGRAASSGSEPSAFAAQEPAPEPQGPGRQQPPDPGAEPPPVEVPETPTGQAPEGPSEPGPEAPAVRAPAAATSGGLPVTGVEVLQLSLLGIALLLVGARLRVLALRRRHGTPAPGRYRRQVEYDHDFDGPIAARRTAPGGIRPSTPTARRREAGRPAPRA